MNYRHAYHAGNFADVVKHATVALIVEHMKRKDGGFMYLDTHAGIGTYDLESEQAGKTGEWRDGIGRILAASERPGALVPYLDVIARMNRGAEEPNRYPGSPMLAACLTRKQDRLVLCELHPEDGAALRRLFSPDKRVGVHCMDGYDALKAFLPPPERRGLVLIDPPFEKRDEFDRLRTGMRHALKRWPTGLFALWYPIKARQPIERFHAELAMLGLPPTLVAEIIVRPEADPAPLKGSGLVLINPPWKLDEALAELLPWLAETLAPGKGGYTLDWLVPEKG